MIKFKGSQGFNLVELMVVVVIIGILAAFVYPSFQSHLMKSRRSDAKMALAELSLLQESYFVKKNGYAQTFNNLNYRALGCTLLDSSTLISKEGYYHVTFEPSLTSQNSFSLVATAKGVQEKDEQCRTFFINHQGLKGSSPNNENCW
jgi:type IV pilus assembly protein PilE